MSTTTGQNLPPRAHFPHAGWIQGSDNVYSSTNLTLAVGQMNAIGNSIHDDLLMVEQEVAATGACLTEGHIIDLKEMCRSIEEKVDGKYRDAAGKVARMNLGNITNATRVLEDNVKDYHGRIRQAMADLRRVRSSTPISGTGHHTPPTISSVTGGSTSAGYKPYMERLKPPVFSGRVEDWPEFRSVWKDLLSGYPDSICAAYES